MKSSLSSPFILFFILASAFFTGTNALHQRTARYAPTHTIAKRAILGADVSVGLCVTLTANAEIDGTVGGSIVSTVNNLDAGTCLCVSALVNLGVGPGGISLGLGAEVTDSTGLVFTGTTAIELANAIASLVVEGNAALLTVLGLTATSGCANCPTGEIRCNGNCYDASQYICQSGNPVKTTGPTKRDIFCPATHDACPVWSGMSRGKRGLSWECVDTQNDVDSCGGCIHPVSLASSVGEDCTAIPNADRTACVLGQCVLLSCRKGWKIIGSGLNVTCAAVETAYSSTSGRSNKSRLGSVVFNL